MKRLVMVCAVIAAATAPAIAQDVSAKDQAKAKYAEGRVHYDVREYAEAIVKWKEAYKLFADPIYLYNIAQAYRLAGDCANATAFYKNYLRVAEAADPLRPKAEKFLVELGTCPAATVVEPVK